MSLINGQTLLARAIETTSRVCRVVVSSDDEEILDEAMYAGAKVLERPGELATDSATSHAVLKHAAYMLQYSGVMLFVQCTAPLMTSDDVQATADGWDGCDMAVAVHEWDGFLLNAKGRCPHYPLHALGSPRRQDVEQLYVCAGSVWAFDTSYLERPWWSGIISPVVRPGFRLEIDTAEDLEMARKVLA